MILVDTSVWIDHLRRADPVLTRLLDAGLVLMHSFVLGQLAVGNLCPYRETVQTLASLPKATIAKDTEVLDFIDRNRLFGMGIGYIDAHLLSSVRLMPETTFWTRDHRLMAIAERLHLTIH